MKRYSTIKKLVSRNSTITFFLVLPLWCDLSAFFVVMVMPPKTAVLSYLLRAQTNAYTTNELFRHFFSLVVDARTTKKVCVGALRGCSSSKRKSIAQLVEMISFHQHHEILMHDDINSTWGLCTYYVRTNMAIFDPLPPRSFMRWSKKNRPPLSANVIHMYTAPKTKCLELQVKYMAVE